MSALPTSWRALECARWHPLHVSTRLENICFRRLVEMRCSEGFRAVEFTLTQPQSSSSAARGGGNSDSKKKKKGTGVSFRQSGVETPIGSYGELSPIAVVATGEAHVLNASKDRSVGRPLIYGRSESIPSTQLTSRTTNLCPSRHFCCLRPLRVVFSSILRRYDQL